MKREIFITFCLILSCSGNSSGRDSLSPLGFTSPPEMIIKEYSGKKLNAREHFILATALKKKKRYLESVFHYLNSSSTQPPLEKKLTIFSNRIPDLFASGKEKTELFDDAAYETANITYRYKRYSDTVKILDQLQESVSGLHLQALLLKAEAYKKMEMPVKGLAVLKRGLELYSDTDARTFLRIRIASIHEKREKWDSAFREYLKVVEIDEKNWQAGSASGRISNIVKGKNIIPATKRDLFLTAKALTINGDYRRSLQLIDAGQYPGNSEFLKLTVKNLCRTGKRRRLNSLFKKQREKITLSLELKKTAAEEYWKMRKKRRSMEIYREIVSSGREPYKKDALKRIARYYSENWKTLESIYITKFYISYPQDPLSGELLWLKGKSALEKNNGKKAADFFERSLKISPAGSFSGNCRFWLYRIYKNEKKNSKATKILYDIVLKNPGSSYTAILLRKTVAGMSPADIKSSFKNPDIGSPEDRTLFYHSLLTFTGSYRGKTSLPFHSLKTREVEKYRRVYNEITGFKINGPHTKRLKKIETYFQIGYNNGIKREISRLRNEKIKEENLFITLSHFGRRYKNYYYSAYYALLTLQKRKLRINPFIMPPDLLKIIYPYPYSECMKRISRKYRIDKNLLYSLIRAESYYRNDAVSRSGAVGLMQLLPSTAKDIAKRLKLKDYALTEPCISIEIGSGYINWLKKYVGDSIIKVLAAYNAGPGRVKRRWTQINWKNDPDYIIEFLPYDETRAYILMIYKYMEHYRMIYGI